MPRRTLPQPSAMDRRATVQNHPACTSNATRDSAQPMVYRRSHNPTAAPDRELPGLEQGMRSAGNKPREDQTCRERNSPTSAVSFRRAQYMANAVPHDYWKTNPKTLAGCCNSCDSRRARQCRPCRWSSYQTSQVQPCLREGSTQANIGCDTTIALVPYLQIPPLIETRNRS